MEGYTEIVKMAEAGIECNVGMVVFWMKRLMINHPEHELVNPFKALLRGEKNPDGLRLEKEVCVCFGTPPTLLGKNCPECGKMVTAG